MRLWRGYRPQATAGPLVAARVRVSLGAANPRGICAAQSAAGAFNRPLASRRVLLVRREHYAELQGSPGFERDGAFILHRMRLGRYSTAYCTCTLCTNMQIQYANKVLTEQGMQ